VALLNHPIGKIFTPRIFIQGSTARLVQPVCLKYWWRWEWGASLIAAQASWMLKSSDASAGIFHP
jgi:hypothetical protein